jgi:hypothetical protein
VEVSVSQHAARRAGGRVEFVLLSIRGEGIASTEQLSHRWRDSQTTVLRFVEIRPELFLCPDSVDA